MEKILIWGTGNYCKKKITAIMGEEYFIIAYIANERNETIFCDKRVIAPDEIINYEYDRILILSSYFFDIIRQMKEMKVEPSKIILGVNFRPWVGIEKRFINSRVKIWINNEYQVFYKDELNKDIPIENWESLEEEKYKAEETVMEKIRLLPKFPVERGQGALGEKKSIKRVYTEDYISKNKQYIRGIVGEMEDRRYTKLFGDAKEIKESYIIQYNADYSEDENYGLDCDFSSGKGIVSDKFDCFICTHTLTYIINLKNAVDNILRMMKHGGVILMTFAGMLHRASAQEIDAYKPYYGILPHAITEILDNSEQVKYWEIETYGNIRCAVATLYGIPSNNLSMDEIMEKDSDYPLIIGVRIIKG